MAINILQKDIKNFCAINPILEILYIFNIFAYVNQYIHNGRFSKPDFHHVTSEQKYLGKQCNL